MQWQDKERDPRSMSPRVSRDCGELTGWFPNLPGSTSGLAPCGADPRASIWQFPHPPALSSASRSLASPAGMFPLPVAITGAVGDL